MHEDKSPSWGTSQGSHGDEYREPMTGGDIGLVVALWACSWVLVVGVVSAIYQVLG